MKKPDFMGNRNIVSKQVRLRRTALQLTQEQLASRLQVLGVNIDQQMISKIESNRRMVSDYELAALCQALQSDPKELLQDFPREDV